MMGEVDMDLSMCSEIGGDENLNPIRNPATTRVTYSSPKRLLISVPSNTNSNLTEWRVQSNPIRNRKEKKNPFGSIFQFKTPRRKRQNDIIPSTTSISNNNPSEISYQPTKKHCPELSVLHQPQPQDVQLPIIPKVLINAICQTETPPPPPVVVLNFETTSILNYSKEEEEEHQNSLKRPPSLNRTYNTALTLDQHYPTTPTIQSCLDLISNEREKTPPLELNKTYSTALQEVEEYYANLSIHNTPQREQHRTVVLNTTIGLNSPVLLRSQTSLNHSEKSFHQKSHDSEELLEHQQSPFLFLDNTNDTTGLDEVEEQTSELLTIENTLHISKILFTYVTKHSEYSVQKRIQIMDDCMPEIIDMSPEVYVQFKSLYFNSFRPMYWESIEIHRRLYSKLGRLPGSLKI